MRKLFLITLVTLLGTIFQAHGTETPVNVDQYILPADHPWRKKINGLFEQVAFDSIIGSRDGGFIPMSRVHRGLMVMHHPAAKGLLFKKFINDKCKPKKELANFIRRIEGARRLKAFIQEKQLKYIATPEKWLYPLPDEGRYILIVEKFDLLKLDESNKLYEKISETKLGELCLVLNQFRGLDSVMHNVPFTKQGQIGFIDTERWEEFRPKFLRHVKDYLSKPNQEYAETQKAF